MAFSSEFFLFNFLSTPASLSLFLSSVLPPVLSLLCSLLESVPISHGSSFDIISFNSNFFSFVVLLLFEKVFSLLIKSMS